jgi:hypothetical protein
MLARRDSWYEPTPLTAHDTRQVASDRHPRIGGANVRPMKAAVVLLVVGTACSTARPARPSSDDRSGKVGAEPPFILNDAPCHGTEVTVIHCERARPVCIEGRVWLSIDRPGETPRLAIVGGFVPIPHRCLMPDASGGLVIGQMETFDTHQSSGVLKIRTGRWAHFDRGLRPTATEYYAGGKQLDPTECDRCASHDGACDAISRVNDVRIATICHPECCRPPASSVNESPAQIGRQ